jgi:hypothetical protein
MKTELEWHKGPALGGGGTAGIEDGVAQWYSGDRIMIIIERDEGRAYAVVDIDCDEHYFRVLDAASGDTFEAGDPSSWSWWAKLDKKNLPPVLVSPASKENPDRSTGHWCEKCGHAMRHNVPRLGDAAGFVHAATGDFLCSRSSS